MFKRLQLAAALALFAVPAVSLAQVNPPESVDGGALPPPQDDHDAIPPAARNSADRPGITQQAGIGGTQAYGRAGVLELGGSVGFTGADNFKQFRATPSIGWFALDNLELSGLININYVKLGSADAQTIIGIVAEPSYHLPLSDQLFLFGGVGAGLSYGQEKVGFLLSPRLGLNLMVGRSGVLSPYVNFDYATVDTVATRDGTLLAVNTSYGFNVGYTVMW